MHAWEHRNRGSGQSRGSRQPRGSGQSRGSGKPRGSRNSRGQYNQGTYAAVTAGKRRCVTLPSPPPPNTAYHKNTQHSNTTTTLTTHPSSAASPAAGGFPPLLVHAFPACMQAASRPPTHLPIPLPAPSHFPAPPQPPAHYHVPQLCNPPSAYIQLGWDNAAAHSLSVLLMPFLFCSCPFCFAHARPG
eukprot:354423-Chlamydomonas_euryale.AAC.6